jgi:hypothetical protein
MPETSAGARRGAHGDLWIWGTNVTGAGSLRIAGAPWWGVALLLLWGSLLWGLVRILQATMPYGSSDRRIIILALLNYNGDRPTGARVRQAGRGRGLRSAVPAQTVGPVDGVAAQPSRGLTDDEQIAQN